MGSASRTALKPKKISEGRLAQSNTFLRKKAANLTSFVRKKTANKENAVPTQSGASKTKKAPKPKKDFKAENEKTQRKLRHSKTRETKLKFALGQLKVQDAERKRAADLAAHRTRELETNIDRLIAEGLHKSRVGKITADELCRRNKALQQRLKRTAGSLSRSLTRAKKSPMRRITEKGIYTMQARKLARMMTDSGCARGKVGSLMQRLGDMFGVHISREMSRRTVGRAIEEGGVAAKMQVVYELSKNKGAPPVDLPARRYSQKFRGHH